MLKRISSIGVGVLLLGGSTAMGGSLSDSIQASRMTVLDVRKDTGQFFCLEHHRWTSIGNAMVVRDDVRRTDVGLMSPGDVVKVERQNGHVSKVVVLRLASEVAASPER
jgi:hypothetical protein